MDLTLEEFITIQQKFIEDYEESKDKVEIVNNFLKKLKELFKIDSEELDEKNIIEEYIRKNIHLFLIDALEILKENKKIVEETYDSYYDHDENDRTKSSPVSKEEVDSFKMKFLNMSEKDFYEQLNNMYNAGLITSEEAKRYLEDRIKVDEIYQRYFVDSHPFEVAEASFLSELVKIANDLDQKNLTAEADAIDFIIFSLNKLEF